MSEQPDYCFDTEQWDCTYEWGDLDMIMDSYDIGTIAEVGCFKRLPNKFVVYDVDDGGYRDFDTFEAAEAFVEARREP